MQIGDNIQAHRKRLGISQEELGQKLFVSRQTVSLWEKGQTQPTIDNLVRLGEIFSVTVDDILGGSREYTEPAPKEIYTFQFSPAELKEIQKAQMAPFYKRAVVGILVSVLLFLFLCSSDDSFALFGSASVLLFFLNLLGLVRTVKQSKKIWGASRKSICASTYRYKVFEDHLTVDIFREEELQQYTRVPFQDIRKVYRHRNHILLEVRNQLFIVRKQELKDYSCFYAFDHVYPQKVTRNELRGNWNTVSLLLFIATLAVSVSFPAVWGILCQHNGYITENFWICFAITPIPIASLIFGCVARAKGHRFTKNIIVGIIVTAILCLFGCFSFLFL